MQPRKALDLDRFRDDIVGSGKTVFIVREFIFCATGKLHSFDGH